MKRAKRRLNAAAMALSIAAHLVVLTALARHAPVLQRPHEDAGPPEPIIPILILPRVPPGAGEKPRPIRLHRRQLHRELAPPPIEPFVAPKEAPTPPAPPRPGPPRVTVQPSPAAQISNALRGGIVGCAHPTLLSASERDRCQERLGRGAAEAPYLPPAISAAKQDELQNAAAAKERALRMREAGVPPGVAAPDADSGTSNRNKPLYAPVLPPLRP